MCYSDTVTTTDETTGEEIQTEQTVTENFAVDFSAHNNGWQYAVDSFALKADVTAVDVTVLAKNIVSDSFATNIELTKDNDAISFDFDETDIEGETTTESEENTEPAPACPCTDCEEIDCPCRCTSAEECTCVQCKRRGNIEEESEDGKALTTKSYDGNKYMLSTVQYSDDLNYITAEIDTNNISSGYAYTDSGLQISSSDGSGVVTTYQTNPMGYLTLAQTNATGLTDNAVKAAISYVYNGDTLTEVNEGNVQYKYSYDEWGQLKNVSVDGNIIVSYNYGNEKSRSQLKNIVFGDTYKEDFTVEYYYTGNDITSIKKYIMVEGEEDAVIYNYEYDNLGNLISIRDNATGHQISYTETGLVIKDINTNQVIYEIADVTPEPEETETEETETPNTNEPVSITQETANGVSYNHSVYESEYDNLTGKTTETEAVVGGKTIGTQTVSDWFGRNESAVVMTKNPVDTAVTDFASITSNYEYKTTGNTTTNLISAINNTIAGSQTKTVNYAYTYDTNGRITGISTVSSVEAISANVSYTYDELGQLKTETNGSTTYEYAYDSKGNITSRKTYSNGVYTKTDAFTYGADIWEDRLTGYNNGTITYDTIGNPTSYLGATLTWRGRELSSYSKENKQISYSYDVDGMRYQKIVKNNGTETARYDYVYSDGKLILLTHTANGAANTARFIYDSFGEPRGFILNNSASYLYLKNGQGDITAIVDENGEILVRYTYNAWGAVDCSESSTIISNVNPFTYRGYCYDFDLGLYYLQSRYYDPEICRFINADSTDYLGATGTLLSYNLFAYCENDPVDYVDPSGFLKIYRGYLPYPWSEVNDDDTFYEPSAKIKLSDKVSWHLWGTAQVAAKKLYYDGAMFYNYFREKIGGNYYYDYEKAYKSDKAIKENVDYILKEMQMKARNFIKSPNKDYYISSEYLKGVIPTTINWNLAIGGHWIGCRARVWYEAKSKSFKMFYKIIAMDRYNFDAKKYDATGKNKSFYGVPDYLNARFVTIGYAKFFTSVGLMYGTKVWRGTL